MTIDQKSTNKILILYILCTFTLVILVCLLVHSQFNETLYPYLMNTPSYVTRTFNISSILSVPFQDSWVSSAAPPSIFASNTTGIASTSTLATTSSTTSKNFKPQTGHIFSALLILKLTLKINGHCRVLVLSLRLRLNRRIWVQLTPLSTFGCVQFERVRRRADEGRGWMEVVTWKCKCHMNVMVVYNWIRRDKK